MWKRKIRVGGNHGNTHPTLPGAVSHMLLLKCELKLIKIK